MQFSNILLHHSAIHGALGKHANHCTLHSTELELNKTKIKTTHVE